MSTINVHQLWATFNYDTAEFLPELLVSWDEYAIEGNESGWVEAKAAALKSLGSSLGEARVIVVAMNLEKLTEAFAPLTVGGTFDPAEAVAP